jgi:hypothetical protein
MGRRDERSEGRLRAAALALASLAALGAAPVSPAGDAARRAFVGQFMAAIRSQDPARVKASYHPAVRACMTPQTQAFYDVIVADDLRDGRHLGPYKVAKLRAITEAPSLLTLPAEGFAYPVKPTYEAQIDWPTGPNSTFVVQRYLAEAGGRWYVVYPCPNARGMAFVTQAMAARAAQVAEGRKLAEAMPADLRQELSGMLAKGHLIDALARYRAATGADDASAHKVIAALSADL